MAYDLYQVVTDKIIASLEAGTAPWVKPWQSTQPHGGMPYNAVTGKPYRGINVFLLFAPMYQSNAWLTFKQARDIGANVRKGEHGSMIVFYKPFAVTDKNAVPDSSGNVAERFIPLLKSYTVFNLAQIENLPAKYVPAAPVEGEAVTEPLKAAHVMAQATVIRGGDMAAYSPALDVIRLPHPEQFDSLAAYEATALHELTHWSGHESRMARQYGKRFGDQAYAREELVAEMGAAFLCARCGIDGQLQHPQYIANWLAVLKADKRAVLTAASHAQKACDYIMRDFAVSEMPVEEIAA